MKSNIVVLLLYLLTISSCSPEKEQQMATLIIHGGTIYTVEDERPTAEAVAIRENKILLTGSFEEVLALKDTDTEFIDLEGKMMTPGFIEGHGHLMGLGYNELELDLSSTTSYQEIIDKVEVAVKALNPGEWIVGRG